MSDNAWYTGVAVVAAGVLVIGVVTGLLLGGAFSRPSAPAPAPVAPVYLYFTVTTSAATDYDTFYPANVTIPHGEPIVITITNYDPGMNPVPTTYDNVIGTVGGTANYSVGTNASATSRTSLPAENLSHSFSMTYPGPAGAALLGAGKPLVNVPIAASPDGVQPSIVSFTILFTAPATYEWRCVAPCDPYSMLTPGFMIGSIFVT